MLGRYTLSRPIRELGFVNPFGSRIVAPTTIKSPFSSQRISFPVWTRPVTVPAPIPESQPVTGSTIVSNETVQSEAVQNAVTNEAQNGVVVNGQPQSDVTPESTVETGPLPEDNSVPSSVFMPEEAENEDNQVVSESLWSNYIIEGASTDPAVMVTTGQEVFEAQNAERAAAEKKAKQKKVVRNVGIGAGIAAAIAAVVAAVR